MVNRRNQRRSRRRRTRNNRASNRNSRNLTLFRKPPNPGPVPRNTGLSAGGLTTTIAFDLSVVTDKVNDINQSGWGSLHVQTTHIELSPNKVFGSRTDAIKGLLALYSEFRFNRITAHWVPSVGWASHGQFCMALVDATYGVANGMTYDDVATCPNSAQVHIGQRVGRAWVPTEPTSLDWRRPDAVAAHLLYSCDQVYAPVGIQASVQVGRIFVRAHVSLRSPTQVGGLTERLLDAMSF